MAIARASQAGDEGSIPFARSIIMKVINKIYLGDVSGIALWFYQTQNIHVDNIKIIMIPHNTSLF